MIGLKSQFAERPTNQEIEEQLRRILTSSRFARSQKQSDFLRFAVNQTLAGKPVSQIIIAQEVFAIYNPDNPLVRVTAAHLRDRLSDFYINEGRLDPIKIDLKKGTYIPVFSHHIELSPEEQELQIALGLASVSYPDNIGSAVDILTRISDHAFAHAVLAELLVKWLSFNVMRKCDRRDLSSRQILFLAKRYTALALKLEPRLALAHIVQAAIHCCHFRWELAEQSFQTALEISPEETQRHWWYAAYLMTIGKKDRALDLAKSHLDNSKNDPYCGDIYRLFLYAAGQNMPALSMDLARRFRARSPFRKVIDDCCRISWVLTGLKKKRPQIPLDPELHKFLSPGQTRAYAGVGAALKYYYHARDENLRESLRELAASWHHNVNAHYTRYGKSMRWRMSLRKETVHDPVQLAILSMATGLNFPSPPQGIPRTPVQHLEIACKQHHPLMVWLHLWPIFDPIRNQPDFKALVQQMRLPA